MLLTGCIVTINVRFRSIREDAIPGRLMLGKSLDIWREHCVPAAARHVTISNGIMTYPLTIAAPTPSGYVLAMRAFRSCAKIRTTH